jgi:excisionase family DNA binding protein
MDEKRTYSVNEAARILGIGRNLAYKLVRNGDIKAIRLGDKRIVVSKIVLEDLLKQKS